MSGESREYASQRDYHSWVQAEADNRAVTIARVFREAFGSVIRQETTEVVVFFDLSVEELAKAFMMYPVTLKPVLFACNIAARAIERDLGIKGVDTYDPKLTETQAAAIAGYMKPFLPGFLSVPTLIHLDRVAFVDKEVRKRKGQWEKRIIAALNRFSTVEFRKTRFSHNGEEFELDALGVFGGVRYAVDIKRIEARRDIHFVQEHGNIRDRLTSPWIDSIVFASDHPESIDNATGLMLSKFGCSKG